MPTLYGMEVRIISKRRKGSQFWNQGIWQLHWVAVLDERSGGIADHTEFQDLPPLRQIPTWPKEARDDATT